MHIEHIQQIFAADQLIYFFMAVKCLAWPPFSFGWDQRSAARISLFLGARMPQRGLVSGEDLCYNIG